MAPEDPTADSEPTATPYPVRSHQAAGVVEGEHTEVSVTYFSDKIMVTIVQRGRLAQWIQVPLQAATPFRREHHLPSSSASDELLPMTELTATTLLGGANDEREITGQLYARQIASAIATRDLDERRTVLVGLGLVHAKTSREGFFDLVELVTQCL